jgi:hypothetical protein
MRGATYGEHRVVIQEGWTRFYHHVVHVGWVLDYSIPTYACQGLARRLKAAPTFVDPGVA